MEPPPSDRRQPPDGHEFPDFEESFQNRFTSRNPQEIEENVNENISDTSPLNKMTSLSNMDLSARQKDENKNIFDEGRGDNFSFLTSSSRSQSLCDIRSRTDDTLYHLVEQRKKNLSKLKGLVIPDSISENDTPPAINLPEIKSNTSTLIEQFNTTDSPQVKISGAPSINSTLPPITPPWAATVNFPKYSPAFKRKDLKLHSFSKPEFERSSSMDLKKIDTFPRKKSLDESTSRSESSDYVIKDKRKRPSRSFCTENLTSSFRRRELNTDEESDNDSAVSSSQSSFASRPLDSPSSVENYVKTIPSDYSSSEFRNVKTSSVEALNRKNILASAKCRSGKDFKIGSPVVNRKLENNEDKTEIVEKPVNIEKEEVVVIEEKNVTKPPEKVTKISEEEKLPEKVPTVVPKKIVEPPVTNLRNIELRSTRTNPVSCREKNTMFLNTLRPVPTVARREERISKFSNRKSLSVTDLRKNFEEIAKNVAVTPTFGTKKLEFLSKASKTVPTQPPEDLPKIHSKQRISLGSKTTNETKENGGKSRKVVLKPNVVGEHVGITISGGADENKDITVHRIRYGSVAYQDGTVIKGDHILSINGKPTAGLSYAEAVQLLKVPADSYVIEIEQKDEAPRDPRILKRRSISLDSTLDSESTTVTKAVQSRKPNHEIILIKDQNGLGFSVEGGRDSPQGDVPVIVKKIFQGGVADKDGRLKVGDQILAINDIDFSNLSRIQAWTIMKKVDLGKTKIMIYR